MISDGEFTIRITGAAPPPLPSVTSTAKAKKGKKGKGNRGGKATGKNNAAPQQQQRRYNLRLCPSSSLEQLRADVFALFNVPQGSAGSYRLSFLGGFPPKELNASGKNTVDELGIRPNESLIVKFSLLLSAEDATLEGGNSASANDNSKQPVSATSVDPETLSNEASNNTGRPKRASAMAATANFSDVIAAQDAILKKDKKSSKKTSSGNKIVGFGGNKIGGFGGNANKRIVTTGGSRPKKTTVMEGGGYRLSDGKSFAGSSPSKKKARSKQHKQKALFESKDDVASTLLSSLNGGGKGGNVGKFLRAAMRGAVAKSYEATRAAVRLAAVDQGEYSFERVKGGSVVEGGGVVLGTAKDHNQPQNDVGSGTADDELGRTSYIVSYSKGMEGRGRYEEEVEIIGLAALKGVLELQYNAKSSNDPDESFGDNDGADGREMLRPVVIAQMSPRIFWSLVYHFGEAAKVDPNSGMHSVEDMLQSALPHLDWTHLDRGGRKRTLSEKAKENLRQKKRLGLAATSSQPSEEEGVKAIEEVEEFIMNASMPNNEEGEDGPELNERERRARAAMARFGSAKKDGCSAPPVSLPTKNDTVDDWTLITPAEDDIDELIECIMEGMASPEDVEEDSSSSENYDEETAKAWAGILLDSVHNYRELANAIAEDVHSKLAHKHPHIPSRDTVEKWIDAAQSRSMVEIMFDILDGDRDALELLVDYASSSCPRDLSNWHSAPGMLLDAIARGSAEEGDISKEYERADVVRWIGRAKVALRVCTWLELFTTS